MANSFYVKERPIISKIIFDGNSEIDTDELKPILRLKIFLFSMLTLSSRILLRSRSITRKKVFI